MKLVRTSSFIFFQRLKIRTRMSGSACLAASKPNLCNLMNSLIVSSTSVSDFDPRSTLTFYNTLPTKPETSFSSNRVSSFSSVIFILFLINLTPVTSSSSRSSSSAWSIYPFSLSYYSAKVFSSSSAIYISLSISGRGVMAWVQSQSIVAFINCRALRRVFID